MERHTDHSTLDALIRAFDEPVFLVDNAGAVMATSPELRRLLGPELDVATKVVDLLPLIASQCAQPARAEELLATMEPTSEATFARPDGGTLKVRATSLDDDPERTVLWRLQIASERPGLVSHTQARRMVEGAETIEDATIALDPDFRILYTNEAMKTILNRVGPGREWQGQVLWEVFPEYFGSGAHHTYLLTMRDRIPRRVLETGGDRLFECTVYPALHGVFACLRDVTEELIPAATEMTGGALRLRNTGLGMAITDGDRLIDVNAAFCEITGYEPHELIGSSFMRLIHPADAGAVAATYRSQIEERARSAEMEIRLVRKDGSPRWVVAWGEVTVGEDGSPQIVAYCHDITERKREIQTLADNHHQLIVAYERQRRVSDELRRIDETKDAFLSAVSHDLRTPLAVILGLASTLHERGGELDEEMRATLTERLWSNASRLSQILTDLLDLDRLQRGIITATARPVNVSELVTETLRHIDIPSSHTVQTHLQPVEAEIDPAMIERVLENLVVNAVRHTTSGTRITIETRAEPDHVLLAVTDDGPGIPEEERSRIFEAFEQGSHRSSHDPGLGIGLSLVARFTALHEGRVWLEDPPGGGARFCVRLPLRRAAPEPARR